MSSCSRPAEAEAEKASEGRAEGMVVAVEGVLELFLVAPVGQVL